MKDAPRQSFRLAPHVSGAAQVKPKDYESGELSVEARNEYDAWMALRSSGEPISVGDLLENEAGELSICKYVGFEKAAWAQLAPEAQTAS